MKTKYTLRGGPMHGRVIELDDALHAKIVRYPSATPPARGAVYVHTREFDADGKRLPILQFLRVEDS